MAIIPGGQQIRTTSADVDLTNRGNALVQKQNHVYTMDDIIETVNAEASGSSSSLPYDSLHMRITQVGNATPTISVLSNDTEIEIMSVFSGTGSITINMVSGTFPAEGDAAVICGGFRNSLGGKFAAFGYHGDNGGQSIQINTGAFDPSGTFVASNLGFGGTNSMLVEVRVYS
jgi:hypothetical protein